MDDYTAIKVPELSEWECELFGNGPGGLVWRPREGCHPNWFWRWMQYLIFGNNWKKKEIVRVQKFGESGPT